MDSFDPFNVAIHGITPDMVASAPRWHAMLPHILEFVGSDTLVAHNAGFDIGVMRYACAADNIAWPEVRFLCTLVLGRRAFSLPSYRLAFLMEAVGATLVDHHNALSDAEAVAQVLNGIANVSGVTSLEELAAVHRVVIGRMQANTYRGSVTVSLGGGKSHLQRPDVNPDADPDGYLYDRVVVFTGALMSMPRQLAWEAVARSGGIPEANTTKRTNVLVLGDFNPANLRPGASFSGKARKVFELQDKGQDIELMTEADFLQALDGQDLMVLDPARLRDPVAAAPSGATATPAPKPMPEFRPLTNLRRPTDQLCSIEECGEQAMFKTRSKPTYCDRHITAILRKGGLEPLEEFTNPDDWRLTRCLHCRVEAHYRLAYTLDKNREGIPTCKACYWREWAERARSVGDPEAAYTVEELQALAADAGLEYLGPLTVPSLPSDPHLTSCKLCGRRSAERACDIPFGCSCHKS